MIKLKSLVTENGEIKETPQVLCPFCKEFGFDLIGLKSHLLNGDCDVFNNTEDLTRI